jgi:hypothetical protein
MSKRTLLAMFVLIGSCLSEAAAAANCDAELASGQAIATSISVSAPEESRAKVGEPIIVEWHNKGINPSPASAYFVLTTPAEVRFSGDGFMAFTAGAKGPSGVEYDHDRARAFVPLHRPIDAAKGGKISVLIVSAFSGLIGDCHCRGLWRACACAGAKGH